LIFKIKWDKPAQVAIAIKMKEIQRWSLFMGLKKLEEAMMMW